MSIHAHTLSIPRGPLLAAALMIGGSLLAVTAIRVSGVDISTRSQAAVVSERSLRFEDQPDGSIRVLEVVDGAGSATTVLRVVEPGHDGFLRGALRALVRQRRSAGIGDQVPFRLVAHADGRLTLDDPATAQRVDLESFGPTNSAVFAQLLRRPGAAPALR
jgi:putative photosynthetic complex assembly protein